MAYVAFDGALDGADGKPQAGYVPFDGKLDEKPGIIQDVKDAAISSGKKLGRFGENLDRSLFGGFSHLANDAGIMSDETMSDIDDENTKAIGDNLKANQEDHFQPQTLPGKVTAGAIGVAPMIAGGLVGGPAGAAAIGAMQGAESGFDAIDNGASLRNAQLHTVTSAGLNTLIGGVITGGGEKIMSKIGIDSMVPTAVDSAASYAKRAAQNAVIMPLFKPAGAGLDYIDDKLTDGTDGKNYDAMPGLEDAILGAVIAVPHSTLEYISRNKIPLSPTKLTDGSDVLTHSNGALFTSPDAAQSFIDKNGLSDASPMEITHKLLNDKATTDKTAGYAVKISTGADADDSVAAAKQAEYDKTASDLNTLRPFDTADHAADIAKAKAEALQGAKTTPGDEVDSVMHAPDLESAIKSAEQISGEKVTDSTVQDNTPFTEREPADILNMSPEELNQWHETATPDEVIDKIASITDDKARTNLIDNLTMDDTDRQGLHVAVKDTVENDPRYKLKDEPQTYLTRLGAEHAKIADNLTGMEVVESPEGKGYMLYPKEPIPTKAERDDAEQRVENLNTANARGGVKGVVLSNDAAPEFGIARTLARVFGVKAHTVSESDDFNGVAQDGHIFISKNSNLPALAVTGHEVQHTLEKSNPDLYNKMSDLVTDYLHDHAVADRKTTEDRLTPKDANGNIPNGGISHDGAKREVIADLNGEMWMDPRFWREMIQRDPNLFRQVAYHFAEVTTRGIEALKGQRVVSDKYINDVDAVRKIMAQAWADHLQSNPGAGDMNDLSFARKPTWDGESKKDIPEHLFNVNSIDSARDLAGSQIWNKGRDLKMSLDERIRIAAKFAKVDLSEKTPATLKFLRNQAHNEILSAIKENANAVGWYDATVKEAFRILGHIHPELNTDPDAKFAFTWALAVTSNGLKVDKNFELAEKAYQIYKDTGKMPTKIGIGTAAKAINESMSRFNSMESKDGLAAMREFMTTKTDVRSLKKAGYDITGEGQDTKVYGASILGPKIGNGFFMNLYGHFDQLTMDRWLMRTFGRWTGTLVEINKDAIKDKRAKLTELVRMLDPVQQKEIKKIIGVSTLKGNADALAVAIQKASMKPELREAMSLLAPKDKGHFTELLGKEKSNAPRVAVGDEMRKMGNGLALTLDGQKEAPGGAVERNFIREIFNGSLAELNKSYPDLTMADSQALLWYPEKRLYDSAKMEENKDDYEDNEAPDYANAAAKLARSKGIDFPPKADGRTGDVRPSARASDTGSVRGDGIDADKSYSRKGEDEYSSAIEGRGRGRGEVEQRDVRQPSQALQSETLNGLPKASPGAIPRIVDAAKEYVNNAGLDHNPQLNYVKADQERGSRLAKAFEEMQHDPQNPEVKAAYEALIKETLAQYQVIKKLGIDIDFIKSDQTNPYPEGPKQSIIDIANGHLWVYPTEDGFGSSDADTSGNPLLAPTGEVIKGHQLLANDVFRIVHDIFGHAKDGVGFGPSGEENAWQSHVRMFSKEAGRALTAETRGQNSWVNFGPHGEANRADPANTRYADQKTGLLPEWASTEGLDKAPQFSLKDDDGKKLTAVFGSLMRAQGDTVFRYPRSDSDDLKTISNEVSRGKTILSDVSLWETRNPGETMQRLEIRVPTPEGIDKSMDAFVSKLGNDVWINVAGFKKGNEGALVYSIVGNWAYNNGYRFVGDPAGLSPVALTRRLQNMLSLSLKFGSTDFVKPHQRQLDKLADYGFKWTDGDDQKNLQSMLYTTYNVLSKMAPELRDVEYNFRTNKFEENGQRFTDEDFLRAANKLHDLSVPGAPGSGTLKIGATIGTIVRGMEDAPVGKSSESVASSFLWAIHSAGMAGAGEADQRSIGRTDLSALTEGQHETGLDNTLYSRKQEDTPEFKEWFGDSKVVDAEGKPLVVYHGSLVKGINEFDTSKVTDRSEKGDTPGTYFTSNPNAAYNYTRKFGSKEPRGDVTPAYLSINNPLDTTSTIKKFIKSGMSFPEAKREALKSLTTDHDGIIFKGNNYNSDEYVAFKPNQIKSATGNNGDFSKDNNDIRYSLKDQDRLNASSRTPELQDAAKKLKDGTLSKEDYNDLVNKYKPVTSYAEVPTPATTSEIKSALTSDKTERIGLPSKNLKEGDKVGLRLDIPAYTNHGVWVVAVHDQQAGFAAGKSIGYESVGRVKDASFGVVENAAENIAAGKPKATIATIKGGWVPTSPKEAKMLADQALTSKDWVQVGMDPERHSYFYDRETTEPVTSASDVIQIGPLVLAKNPVFGSKQDFKFSRKEKESPIEHAKSFMDDIKGSSVVRDATMSLIPMSAGSGEAKSTAQKFVNALRLANHQWQTVDQYIATHFNKTQREAMWNAADEQSVLLQKGESTEGKGLDTLPSDQRSVMESMHQYSQELWQRAKAAGMVKGDGLKFWTPRMAVVIGTDGEFSTLSSSGKRASSDGTGSNLFSNSPYLKNRKYLTAAETEAAMKNIDPNAELVRDARTMPLAMARLEQAIAGRELINQIKAFGQVAGKDLVTTGKDAGFVTIDHPALTTFRPRFEMVDGKPVPQLDQNGDAIMDRDQLFVHPDWEGPLRAVLSQNDGAVYRGYMLLKSKAMSAIMVSPLTHNLVILGRALAYNPAQVLSLRAYFVGNALARDPELMSRAIGAGMVPMGANRSTVMDVTDVARGLGKEGGWGDINESWIAKSTQALVGVFSKSAGDSVKAKMDAFGDFYHHELLWKQVGALQTFIFNDYSNYLTSKGHPQAAADAIAANLANRYGGAVARENMSAMARKALNVMLFSRSFNVGNVGAVKDTVYGMPAGLAAKIYTDVGKEAGDKAMSAARGKARMGIVADLGMSMLLSSVASSAIAYLVLNQSEEDIKDGYIRRLQAMGGEISDHPMNPNSYNPYQVLPSWDNEPGKQDRVDLGANELGQHEYMRLPTGKVIEDTVGWLTELPTTFNKKLSPIVGSTWKAVTNDRGFGVPVEDPEGSTLTKVAQGLGFVIKAQIPYDNMKTIYDMSNGVGTTLDAHKTIGFATGFTTSQGNPMGPEAAVDFKVADRVKESKAYAMDEVKRDIKYGKDDEAEALLEKIGLSPIEINKIIRNQESPRSGESRKMIKDFNMHATDKERELKDRLSSQN